MPIKVTEDTNSETEAEDYNDYGVEYRVAFASHQTNYIGEVSQLYYTDTTEQPFRQDIATIQT